MDDVKTYMSDPSVHIDSEATVMATVKLMRDNMVGSILITKGTAYVGIFTETDLLRKVAAESKPMDQIKISTVMSAPLLTVDCDASMVQAFALMQRKNIRHLAVTRKDDIVGILSIKDIANYYVNKFTKKASKPQA